MANWGNIRRLGNPRSAGWADKNLTTVAAPNGAAFRVNKLAASDFKGFLKDLDASGYDIKSSGGYNLRNIRGRSVLSQHAFGTAIDVNADSNPMLSRGDGVVTDLPSNIRALAADHNLEWGGDFRRPDAMHFEWKGPNGQEVAYGGDASQTADAGGGHPAINIPGGGTESNANIPGALSWASSADELKAADANADGDVTVTELKEYNANLRTNYIATHAKVAGKGDDDNVAKAIVTAGNQQAITQANALKAIAAGIAGAQEAASASATSTSEGWLSWIGSRLLQIMVFVVAIVFLLIGLYMFAPREIAVQNPVAT